MERKKTNMSENLFNQKVPMPWEFNLSMGYELNRFAETVTQHYCQTDKSKISFLYTHYAFIHYNILDLLDKRGSKWHEYPIRNIIKTYIQYLNGEEYLRFLDRREKSIPEFGAEDEWVEFCDALNELYRLGHPDRYLKAYNTLLNAEKRQTNEEDKTEGK